MRMHTLATRAAGIVLTLSGFGLFLYGMWGPLVAAWLTRSGIPDVAIYERAVYFDPANADYRFVLAQLYHHSVPHLNLQRAREEYQTAVKLNPDRSMYWIELSKYYEQTGDIEFSRGAMRMALEKDPNYAVIHWAAANLYARLNEYPAAHTALRRTAELDISYLPQILDLAQHLYQDTGSILSIHVPNTKDANLAALHYFIAIKSEDGALAAWDRLKKFQTNMEDRTGYSEYLVSIGKPHDASRVFTLSNDESAEFFNAGFENEPLNRGFDWHFTSSRDVRARRDVKTAEEGRASFRIDFSGKGNINDDQLWHWLPVETDKKYKLRFWMKTQDISTDEVVFVEAGGQSSQKQTGTIPWTEFSIPFVATSELITVRMRRMSSSRLDNFLRGTVWVDDFSLEQVR